MNAHSLQETVPKLLKTFCEPEKKLRGVRKTASFCAETKRDDISTHASVSRKSVGRTT